jgi:hypothetical protein
MENRPIVFACSCTFRGDPERNCQIRPVMSSGIPTKMLAVAIVARTAHPYQGAIKLGMVVA